MAGIASLEQLHHVLKEFYSTKKYSDVQIEVTEELDSQCEWNANSYLSPTTPSEVESEGEYMTPLFTIDAHALVLHLNSVFFENKLVNHKEGRSSKLEVTIKRGQGKYLKIIVNAFYDADVLDELNEIDLLKVLELAKTYCNEEFVKKVVNILEERDVNVLMYNTILTRILTLENSSIINTNIMAKIKSNYVGYLTKLFSPIEEKHGEHKNFMQMEYASLLYLLQGDGVLSISENSLLTFVTLWLRHDPIRETATIIEGLLKNIRVKFLSVDFLLSVIKSDNVTLNKWHGFSKWFIYNLGFHGMSDFMKQIEYPHVCNQQKQNVCNQISRNTKDGIHAWYKNATNTILNACRWLVLMTVEKPGEEFTPTTHILVHDGFQFSPKLIKITPIEGDQSRLDMNLSISCNGSLCNIRFVVGIVPADREYDVTENKHFGSMFAQNFLKLTEPLTFKSDTQVINYWTIDKAFIDYVNEHGLYILLLPITEGEYKELSNMKFCCGDGRHAGYMTINTQCTWLPGPCRPLPAFGSSQPPVQNCPIYPTSQSTKLYLTSTVDYSL